MVSFSGIGSGIDFSSLIDGFVRAERLPINQINARKSEANEEITRVGDIVDKLKALETVALDLDRATEVRAVVTSSSDPDRLAVEADDTAAAATYLITVNQRATAQMNGSQTYATDDPGVAGTGTLDITVGTDATVTVNYDASMSLTGVAAAINDSGARVTASVLFDGTEYRLVVQGSETGAANDVTFAETGTGLGLAGSSALIAAQDALFDVNGIAVSRSSNQVSDLAPGLKLDLKATTPQAATVEVRDDAEALREKLGGFVDAYNAVVDALNAELSFTEGTDGSPLLGDTTLRGLQSRLSSITTQAFPDGTDTVSLGTVGLDLANDGTISVDAAAFDAAVTADPTTVQNLLAGDGVTGVIAELKALVTEYTQSGSGILLEKQSGLQDRLRDYDRQIERVERRASSVETRLRRTFAALDARIAELNSQSSFLASFFPQQGGQ